MKRLLFVILYVSLLLGIGVLWVFQGGTSLATGTSGGYFSSGMASSSALTSNVLVKEAAPLTLFITDNDTILTYSEMVQLLMVLFKALSIL